MGKSKFSLVDIMNSQSVAEKRPQTGDGFRIVEIPIERIRPSGANMYGIRDVEELAANIESMGLMHNLVVRAADGDDMYEIVSGERRYRACMLLHEADASKFATIPCKVEYVQSDALAELKLIYANATARELTDYEKTMQARRIKELLVQLKKDGHEFKGRMRDIVAGMLDVSPAQMGRMDSINDHLIDGFKDEFRAGNIGITAAYEASTLDERKQAEAYEAYEKVGAPAITQAKHEAKQEDVRINSGLPQKPIWGKTVVTKQTAARDDISLVEDLTKMHHKWSDTFVFMKDLLEQIAMRSPSDAKMYWQCIANDCTQMQHYIEKGIGDNATT